MVEIASLVCLLLAIASVNGEYTAEQQKCLIDVGVCGTPIMSSLGENFDLGAEVASSTALATMCGNLADLDLPGAKTCVDGVLARSECSDMDELKMYEVMTHALAEVCDEGCTGGKFQKSAEATDTCLKDASAIKAATVNQTLTPSTDLCDEAKTVAPCLEKIDPSCKFTNRLIKDAVGKGAPSGSKYNLADVLDLPAGLRAIKTCGVTMVVPGDEASDAGLVLRLSYTLLALTFILGVNQLL